MVLDQEFNPYPSAISFESDYANSLNDLLVLNESIYVACKFSEELSFEPQIIKMLRHLIKMLRLC